MHDLTSEERIKYRRFIEKELHMDHESARNLIKAVASEKARIEKLKAIGSIVVGGAGVLFFLYLGLSDTESYENFGYAAGIGGVGIYRYCSSNKRLRYLETLKQKHLPQT